MPSGWFTVLTTVDSWKCCYWVAWAVFGGHEDMQSSGLTSHTESVWAWKRWNYKIIGRDWYFISMLSDNKKTTASLLPHYQPWYANATGQISFGFSWISHLQTRCVTCSSQVRKISQIKGWVHWTELSQMRQFIIAARAHLCYVILATMAVQSINYVTQMEGLLYFRNRNENQILKCRKKYGELL